MRHKLSTSAMLRHSSASVGHVNREPHWRQAKQTDILPEGKYGRLAHEARTSDAAHNVTTLKCIGSQVHSRLVGRLVPAKERRVENLLLHFLMGRHAWRHGAWGPMLRSLFF